MTRLMQLTFAHWAEDALRAHWTGRIRGFDVKAPEWRPILDYASDRLLDFVCILTFKNTYWDLIADGDRGLLQLATLLKDCLQNQIFLDRYREAKEERDGAFLNPFLEAIRKECKVDGRILNRTILPKYFIFMNWEFPLLNPELGCGLAVLHYAEILALLDQALRNSKNLDYDRFVDKWDVPRIKQEVRRLRLKRTSQAPKLAKGPYFFSSRLEPGYLRIYS